MSERKCSVLEIVRLKSSTGPLQANILLLASENVGFQIMQQEKSKLQTNW